MSSGPWEIVYVPSAGRAEVRPARDPDPLSPGEILVRTLRVGFCGTDREIVRGGIAVLPEGQDVLVLGHEMVGVVEEAGPDTPFTPGDVVVPTVRTSCGACDPCRAGRSDFCLTGAYLEHGITRLDGFARPYLVLPADRLVAADGLGPLAVLAEPASVVVKAIEQAKHALSRVPGLDLDDEWWGKGRRALVAGAGTIGLLATYLLTQRGFEVEVIDVHDPDGALAPRLVRATGATYTRVDAAHPEEAVRGREPAHVVLEAAGDPHLAFELLRVLAPAGVLVWIGTHDDDHAVTFELGRSVLHAVLNHHAVVATVNSCRDHFARAIDDLLVLRDRPGFEDIVTAVLPVERFEEAIWPNGEAIKQVVAFSDEGSGAGG